MKKLILIVLIINLSYLNAQSKKIKVSFVSTFTQLSFKSIDKNRTYQPGAGGLNYVMGGKFSYELLDHKLHFSVSALYDKTAYFTRAKSNEDANPTAEISLAYFQTPISIGWGAINKDHFSMAIPVGIIPSFLIKSNSLNTFDNYISNFMIGYHGGIDFRYTKNHKLFLSLKPSFTYFKKGFDTFEKNQVNMYQLILGIGYMF
jgi:hypothetical protein